MKLRFGVSADNKGVREIFVGLDAVSVDSERIVSGVLCS